LVELLIAIVLLGVMASVATLTMQPLEETPPDDPNRILADSLRAALATGRTITIHLRVDGERALATIHPDGSIVADSIVRVDRLSGVRRALCHPERSEGSPFGKCSL
jgi:hypothetical protein